MRWDIFCRVIDNHGDIGVCWRLARGLAGRGQAVRLWIDDASALSWMAPDGDPGVQVGDWTESSAFGSPGDVVVEAFGCELPDSVVAAMAARPRPPRWINLEYLTAEAYAERAHRLPSPVQSGPGKGLAKHFFYPGFTAATGGLLREPDLLQRQAQFDRAAWLGALGIGAGGERLVSLFCYEPAALPQLLRQLDQASEPTRLLVTAGRATAAVQAALRRQAAARLQISWLPLLTQDGYDHLLWSCDFNFVRGEDSLVRALWAGAPFAWQIYPQQDDAHHAKLAAFLEWLQAPPSLGAFHLGWNGIASALPPLELPAWQACAAAARARLLLQDDLVTQLLRFAP
ncbi:elongation factor P maturation arginine rhamnosyltransferase EarP [Caenimonas terrae]|uniref:Protein-arginine rhamnosyltransferase n=1 Tax=Caenimonas terrae TaxID=696074 RepID=A0ABW0NJ51_9BURK